MIKKKIQEYGKKSKRQRIDINLSDGFKPGDEVVLILADEYDEIKSKLFEYNALVKENQLLNSQEQNLKEIVEDVTTPIYSRHEKELQDKDTQIKQLQMQIDTLKKIFNQFIIDITSLSAWDIFFRGKHKDLISDFNSKIWITTNDNQVEEVDQPAIPGGEGKK